MVSGPSISRGRASIRVWCAKSEANRDHSLRCMQQPHSANGVTPNTIIDSNDEPAGNNQQRMVARGY